MDFQLMQIRRKYPQFFFIIENALSTAYQLAKAQMSPDMLSDELCQQRRGYYILTNVDHELRRAFENATFDGIQIVPLPNSNRSNYHLEIRTPFAIFMVAKIYSRNSVPHKAYYRQKYSDQTFMTGLYPEYKMFTDECVPVYIINHMFCRSIDKPQSIRVGRLSIDQKSWIKNYPISDLQNRPVEEIIEKRNEPRVHNEIIANSNRIKRK